MNKTPFKLGLAALSVLGYALGGIDLAAAHAFLDHAVPGVGSTVSVAPETLTLVFTEAVVPALSGISLNGPGGKGLALGKPAAVAGDTLQVRLQSRLSPGVYVVTWHVVSVDTHKTSGTFRFTVGGPS